MPAVRLYRLNSGVFQSFTDLTGVDLREYDCSDVNLTGVRRSPDDRPIDGWFVVDGKLIPLCAACGQQREYSAECDRCEGCCTHYVCSSCDAHRSSRTCRDCDECNDCCTCERCNDCGDVLHESDTCGYCSEHCECEEREVSVTTIHEAPKKTKFPCRRLAGVEWEMNERPREVDQWADKWGAGVHSDGSCGWEAVTPPIAGDNIRKCLTDLGKAIVDSRTNVNESCGVHVHVDARDLGWSDMYRLLWVYGRVEALLYVLAGHQRVKNQYCLPIGDAFTRALGNLDRKGAVLGAVFNQNAPTARTRMRQQPNKKDGGRYRGLNICPWIAGRRQVKQFFDMKKNRTVSKREMAKDTTVEFRMHSNTKDAERLINWTELLVTLVEWCAKATDKEAQALPQSPLRALCVIAPSHAPWILARVKEWRVNTTTRRDWSSRRPQERRAIRYKSGVGITIAA